MHRQRLRKLAWSSCLAFALAAGAASAAEEGPSFGSISLGYESLTFRQELVWPLDLCADSAYGVAAKATVMAQLPRYKTFFFNGGGADQLSPDNLKILEAWVAAGGNLILASREGGGLFGNAPPAWSGRKSWGPNLVDPKKHKVQVRALQPDHPLVKDLNKKILDAMEPVQVGLKGAEGGKALLVATSADTPKGDEAVLIWVHEHGKGRIVYLGGTLTPPRVPAWKEGQIAYTLDAAAVTVWRNMIEFLKLPTRTEMIQEWGRGRKAQTAVWWRYVTDEPLGAAMAYPPFPKENELLDAVRFDVGRGDRYWQYLFFTSVPAYERLEVRPTDLRGPGGASIPASAVEVLIQEPPGALYREIHETPPLPGHRKAPYWLVPLKYVAPVGEDAARLPGARSTTFWVKLTCPDPAAPGEYEGRLVFKEGANVVAEVPLKATVWDLQSPEPEVLHFEYEHDWACYPGGYFLDPKRREPALVARFQRQTAELGIDFAQSTGLDSAYALEYIRLCGDGRNFREMLKANPEILSRDPLPQLDFSWFDTMYFDSGTESGMRNFSTNIVANSSLVDWIRAISGRKDLNAPQITDWLVGQLARYIKERGYPVVYCKTMDEFEPKDVDAFVPTAAMLKKAGFRTYTTTPNFMYTAEAVRKADPVLDLWQSRNHVEPFPQFVKRAFGFSLDATDEFWPYGASSFPGNKGMDWSRMDGWATAFARNAGYHFHHYYRWYQDDRQGAVAGPDCFYDAAVSPVRAMSINGGRYLATLYRMIAYARARKLAPGIVGEIEKGAGQIVGTEEGSLLKIGTALDSCAIKQGQKDVKIYDGSTMSMDPRVHDLARRKLMELALRLKKAIGDVKPTVKYGDLCLVQDGQARFQLVCAEKPEAMAPLVKRVAELAGATAPAPQPIQISAGTLAGNAPLKALLEKAFPGRFTATYPPVGHYAIVLLPAPATSQIIIVGGDAAGVSKGIDRFGRFLCTENRW